LRVFLFFKEQKVSLELMGNEINTIVDRDTREKLVPVISYVHCRSLQATGAWLSFLSVCHNDLNANRRLPNELSADDEACCIVLLDELVQSYCTIKRLPLATQRKAIDVAGKIILGLSEESKAFLKRRLIKICGEDRCREYWAMIGSDAMRGISLKTTRAAQLKKTVDFSYVIIALTMLYCSTETFRGRMAILTELQKKKYTQVRLFERQGLYLWPLDFSFMEDERIGTDCNGEYLALLKAARSINPDFRVQILPDSLLWSRDIIAWVDDGCNAFVKSTLGKRRNVIGAGLLSEGGNIVTGTSLEKFVLVARGAFSETADMVDFYYEMFKRDIRAYALPDGFLWARNPVTQEDMVLDSIHIDSVINSIPSSCTVDGRPKVIIDPFYHEMVKDDAEYVRFIAEQAIVESDVVVVDESELYLNLPNFCAAWDKNGETKLLFNKDKGQTVPKLKIKPEAIVQPAIEITGIASYFGSIRCLTNMLPESYVEKGGPVNLGISDGFSPQAKETISRYFQNHKDRVSCLSNQWVSTLELAPGIHDPAWEFDETTRTGYLYLSFKQAGHPEIVAQSIETCLEAMARTIGQRLGTSVNLEKRQG
jgi:hypothetical protein